MIIGFGDSVVEFVTLVGAAWTVLQSAVAGESSHYTLPRVVTELCDRDIICYLCDVWHCIISM